MQLIGKIAYLLVFIFSLLVDWKVTLCLIFFYIAFKIELYDNRESGNN